MDNNEDDFEPLTLEELKEIYAVRRIEKAIYFFIGTGIMYILWQVARYYV